MVEQTGLFNLGVATDLREGKFWTQTSFTLLKNWIFVSSFLWWTYIYPTIKLSLVNNHIKFDTKNKMKEL